MPRLLLMASVALVAPGVGLAQDRVNRLEAIEVVASSPLDAPDTGAERGKYPAGVTVVSGVELAETRQGDLAQALVRDAGMGRLRMEHEESRDEGSRESAPRETLERRHDTRSHSRYGNAPVPLRGHRARRWHQHG